MDGEKIYSSAIILTDRHDRRFSDMLISDSRQSEIEREFFVGEFNDMPIMGWNEFCAKMVSSGQGEWLDKLYKLDEEILLSTLERRLLDAVEGGSIKKEQLDGAVKAITGLVGRSKILSEQRAATIANTDINVRIIQSKSEEQVLAESKEMGEGDGG